MAAPFLAAAGGLGAALPPAPNRVSVGRGFSTTFESLAFAEAPLAGATFGAVLPNKEKVGAFGAAFGGATGAGADFGSAAGFELPKKENGCDFATGSRAFGAAFGGAAGADFDSESDFGLPKKEKDCALVTGAGAGSCFVFGIDFSFSSGFEPPKNEKDGVDLDTGDGAGGEATGGAGATFGAGFGEGKKENGPGLEAATSFFGSGLAAEPFRGSAFGCTVFGFAEAGFLELPKIEEKASVTGSEAPISGIDLKVIRGRGAGVDGDCLGADFGDSSGEPKIAPRLRVGLEGEVLAAEEVSKIVPKLIEGLGFDAGADFAFGIGAAFDFDSGLLAAAPFVGDSSALKIAPRLSVGRDELSLATFFAGAAFFAGAFFAGIDFFAGAASGVKIEVKLARGSALGAVAGVGAGAEPKICGI